MELKIKKETAKKIYADAPDSLKEILIETFGLDTFTRSHYTDIKTFEDACIDQKIGHGAAYFTEGSTDEIAYKKLKVVIRAINQGWIPDWNNTDQYKWWPWFVLSSGFGFSRSDYGYGRTSTLVGSRLCFESEEKSNYAAKQFIDLYEEFITIKK
jgi:hypothetical protein